MRFLAVLSVAILIPLATEPSAWGQAGVREDFEGPETRLKLSGSDAAYRIEIHRPVDGGRSGDLCEFLQIHAGRGANIHMSLPVKKEPYIIDELMASVWLKSDRTGPQVLGRVVLPHTRNPDTGAAATVLIAGDSYKDVGRWQQLHLKGLPKRLLRAVRTLQLRFGTRMRVDAREAYLDLIVLNVYAGEGRVHIWVDELEITGIVGRRTDAAWLAPPVDSVRSTIPQKSTKRPQISCRGSQLFIGERPFFPRAIQYQGEPLEFLKKLGFNALHLQQTPSAELLSEAERLGLWVIAPPPPVHAAAKANPFAAIGPQWDPILAWDLGAELTTARFDVFCQRVKAIRRADRGRQAVARPIVCDVLTNCRAFSRHVDILCPSRRPLGTTLELTDFGVWLRERPRLARPGAPFWTVIQTHTSQAYVEQVRRLTPGSMPRTIVSSEQIRLLTYSALSAGIRGIIYESRSRLDAKDAETGQRAKTLELLNIELELAEPWISAGSLVATVPCSVANIYAALLRTDKARLLLPAWFGPGGQFVTGQSAANNVSFTVPGVSVSNDAYEITPSGMRRINHRRVTGGLRVTLKEFGMTSMILFTSDPLVLRVMKERIRRTSQRAGRLRYELAVAKFAEVQQVHRHLSALQVANARGEQYLKAARAGLRQIEAALQAKKFDQAYRLAGRVVRPLQIMERTFWEQALQGASPATSPMSANIGTLPQHWQFVRRLRTARWAPNQLPAGDCENVDKMRASGWRLSKHHGENLRAEAEIATGNPRFGRFSLRLKVQSVDPEAPPDLLESPPLWMTTPSVPVAAGGVVRIHGWVRVPAPITGSVDGLMIYDSLAGPDLAERIDVSDAWKEFTLFRAAGNADSVSVTFVLTGLGEAWIDDVTIEPLLP